MEFFDVLEARHSIRAYEARPVEPEKLQCILEAVRRAPSAGNLQAYEIYLVRDEHRRVTLAAAAGDQEFLIQAPLSLVFCAHASLSAVRYGERGVQLYCIQDATIACTYAMLAAAALGLSTVWVGAFNAEDVRTVIGAPEEHRPVAILPMGYPAETPRIRARRSLSEIVHPVS